MFSLINLRTQTNRAGGQARSARTAVVLLLASMLGACGGGGGGGGAGGAGGGEGGSAYYTVGGTVTGLTGSGLVLRNNGGEDLAVDTTGSFAFTTKVANGAAYGVTVSTEPTNPAQNCVVTDGAGTVNGGSVTTITVDCTISVAGSFAGVDYGTSGDDASFGITPLNDAGSFTSTSTENSAGTIIPGQADTGTYAVSGANAIVLNYMNGAVSADGSTILLADLNPGEQAYIDIEVMQGQKQFTNADLVGGYALVTYGNRGDSGTLWTLIADGAGDFTGSEVHNNAGVISPGSALTGTYVLAADGTLTVTPDGGAPLSGGVSADGKTLVLSQLTSGQNPSITVGIQQAQGAQTTAALAGTFEVATLENSADEGSLWSIDFDSKGNFSGTGTHNDNGTISSITISGTYAFAADGTLALSPAGGGSLSGSLSADGLKLVLTDLNAGDSPVIWLGALTQTFDLWGY